MSRAPICHPNRPHYARGLCKACHERNSAAGTLHLYPRRTRCGAELLDGYRRLTAQGYAPKQAARRLGVTHNALKKALGRARRASTQGTPL